MRAYAEFRDPRAHPPAAPPPRALRMQVQCAAQEGHRDGLHRSGCAGGWAGGQGGLGACPGRRRAREARGARAEGSCCAKRGGDAGPGPAWPGPAAVLRLRLSMSMPERTPNARGSQPPLLRLLLLPIIVPAPPAGRGSCVCRQRPGGLAADVHRARDPRGERLRWSMRGAAAAAAAWGRCTGARLGP